MRHGQAPCHIPLRRIAIGGPSGSRIVAFRGGTECAALLRAVPGCRSATAIVGQAPVERGPGFAPVGASVWVVGEHVVAGTTNGRSVRASLCHLAVAYDLNCEIQ